MDHATLTTSTWGLKTICHLCGNISHDQPLCQIWSV